MKRIGFKKKAAYSLEVGNPFVSKENCLPETILITASSELLGPREILETLELKEEDVIFFDGEDNVADATVEEGKVGIDIINFEENMTDYLQTPEKVEELIRILSGYKEALEVYSKFSNPYVKIKILLD